jgi:hypothetical protein
MTKLIDKIKPLVDETTRKLNIKKFDTDPIAGKHLSKVVSVMSSAYKRHANIIVRSIFEQLKYYDRFEVWEEPKFAINEAAQKFVERIIDYPERVFDHEYKYEISTNFIKIDFIVHDKSNGNISAYNIKRGNGIYDAGKKRLLFRDTLLIQTMLKSYGKTKNLSINKAKTFIIFYYGKVSLPKKFSLTRDDLDAHFDCSIINEVEEVNEYFKKSLIKIINN